MFVNIIKVQGIECAVNPLNFRHFIVKLEGPQGTSYESDLFITNI